MRFFFLSFLLLFSFSLSAQWKLVYEHDAEGNALSGSKEALIDAISAGAEVRIGWKMGSKEQYVQHYAEGKFLSILNDEVFAQIEPILSQNPDFTNTAVTFREDLKWSFIASTTGTNATFFYLYETGKAIDKQAYKWGNQWFVKN